MLAGLSYCGKGGDRLDCGQVAAKGVFSELTKGSIVRRQSLRDRDYILDNPAPKGGIYTDATLCFSISG